MIPELTTEQQLRITAFQDGIVNTFQSLSGGLIKACGQAGCGIKWIPELGRFEGSCRMGDAVCQVADLSRQFQKSKLPACAYAIVKDMERKEQQANLAEFLSGGDE